MREVVNSRLCNELVKPYEQAINSTKLLPEVDDSDTPMTQKHYCNDNLCLHRSVAFNARVIFNLHLAASVIHGSH